MESAMHDPNLSRCSCLSKRSSLERSIKHYSNFHQILLVGEGDFSFSSALANAFGSAENMVPTSLNSREKVLQLYKSAHEPLSNLEKLGAMILHEVDATTMENHHIIRKMRFHRIVYNFPHAGFYGKEVDKNVIEKHQNLLKIFFKNARSMLSEIGEIHVTHKAYGPYRRWELVKQAEECGLLLKESVYFAIEDYPGYTNRRGAGSAASLPFSLGKCRTYKFILGPDLLYQRKLVAIQVILSNFSSEASAESSKTAILEPESEMQARMSASEESLRAALMELKYEKKARKAVETSKAELESAFRRLKELALEALKKRDEFARQRDDALRQKDESCREKEVIVQQLNGALRLKENAFKQKDEILGQRNDLARQKDEIHRLKEEATKENQTLKKIAKETKQSLKNLELKIEKQKPIVSDQLDDMFKAQECLQNIIKKIDGSAYDQLDCFEPLFLSQHLDIDEDLMAPLTGAVVVSELATVASKKLNIDKAKGIKEKKALEDNTVSLVAEKRDIRTLPRGALGEKVGNDTDCKELTEGSGENQTDLCRRNDAILNVKEKALQNAVLDFRVGTLVADPDIVVINGTKEGEEAFGLASTLGSIIKSPQLEITELRHGRETLRQRDEFAKQRDDALHQKEEACRRKEVIAQQLDEALRLKEDEIKQIDDILRQRNNLARQKDEIHRLKEEATKARESSRSEILAAAQMLINMTEKITSRVSAIKSFGGGLPRSSKHSGLVAIAYGATKRAQEIVEELLRKNEIITKGRNDVREQMEQRSYQIDIEVSHFEATVTGLREELESKCIESYNLQKLVLAKDGRISELESEMSEKLDQEEKEYHTLKRIANETEEKLKNAKLKLEKQKPVVSDQLNHIFEAQECLQNIIKKIDGSAYDQSEFCEPLFVSQDLDIDKDMVASLSGVMFVQKLATVAEKKIIIDQEKRNKEKKELKDNIVCLVAEKRDISALLRSATGEKVAAKKYFKELPESNGENQTDSPQSNGTILDVAERGLQNTGLDFRAGSLEGDPDILSINGRKGVGQNGFGLCLGKHNENITVEIAELQRALETLRAELEHLRRLSETQTKDLAEKTLHIQELEERERAATENVEGFMMDIAAAEEEIGRWREAAEQEAAAGKAVMEELQEEITKLRRELEEVEQSLDEANNKLKSKEEMAAAAMASIDTFHLADARSSRLRARIEELTKQLEALDGGDEQQNLRKMRYACWPVQWLPIGILGTYNGSDRDENNNSVEMELSHPLLQSGRST